MPTWLAKAIGVRVSVRDGTLVSIPGREKNAETGRWETVSGYPIMTARGYDLANQSAGVIITSPPTVAVNGEQMPNPHFTIDAGGSVSTVFVRRIAIHRSRSGALNAREHTAVYDPLRYLMEDLSGISGRAGKSNDVYGGTMPPGGAPPEDFMFFPQHVSEFGAIGLFARGCSPDVMRALRAFSERRKKAPQIAATHCDRDVLRKVLGGELIEMTDAGEAIFEVYDHAIDAATSLDRERVLGLATVDPATLQVIGVDVDDSTPEGFDSLQHEPEDEGDPA